MRLGWAESEDTAQAQRGWAEVCPRLSSSNRPLLLGRVNPASRGRGTPPVSVQALMRLQAARTGRLARRACLEPSREHQRLQPEGYLRRVWLATPPPGPRWIPALGTPGERPTGRVWEAPTEWAVRTEVRVRRTEGSMEVPQWSLLEARS